MYQLALINKTRYGRKNLLLSVIFIIITTIFLLFGTIRKGIITIFESLKDDDDLKEIMVYPNNRHNGEPLRFNDKFKNVLNGLEGVEALVAMSIYQIGEDENIKIRIGEEELRIIFELRSFDYRYDVFLPKTVKAENIDQHLVLGGDFTENKHGVLIDENIVYLYDMDVDDIIGEKIDIVVNGEIIALDIVGVYNKRLSFGQFGGDDFQNASEHYKTMIREMLREDGIVNPIIFNTSFLETYFPGKFQEPDIILEAKNIEKVVQIHNFIEENSDYFVFSQLGEINKILDIVKKYTIITEMVFVSIAMALIFIVVINTHLKMQRQREFISVMHVFGMTKRKLIGLYLCENIITLVPITVFSTVFTIITSYLLDVVMAKSYTELIRKGEHLFFVDLKFLLIFIIVFAIVLIISSLLSVILSVNRLHYYEGKYES